MPLESRRVAALLLTYPDGATWRKALVEDNILQKKAPATALRQAKLIRNRLNALDVAAWDMIVNCEQDVVIQLLLMAAIKHSQLLLDFMSSVYWQHLRRLDDVLAPAYWDVFLAECAHRDSTVSLWSASTKAKLFQVILRILAEAKYLENTRSMKLTPQILHPDVRRYLATQGDTCLLSLMESR